jgi:general secretion pathway protein L
MVAFASVFCLHAIVTVVDWLRLRNEATSIRAEMNARFRSVFPDAKAIVDPALQMSRNLADLRRSGGQPDPSDFVPLLAQIAGKLGPSGVKPQKIRYEKGQLQLDLPISAGETKESIEAKLAAEGLRIQVETVTSSTASVSITVSGKGT